MRRFLFLLLTAVLALQAPPAAALGTASGSKEAAAIAGQAEALEKKYGIHIRYPGDDSGKPVIAAGDLETLDMALENVTPAAVRQISQYYEAKNGGKLTYSFTLTPSLEAGTAAIRAGFNDKTSVIQLYLPTENVDTVATGVNPISIVHELGHAFHFLCADRYGRDKMQAEWLALNGDAAYSAGSLQDNPNTQVFITGYAASMYEEDVAETFAHAFVRNSAGLGFTKKLSSGGRKTALGRKVDYVETLLSTYLDEPEQALANYRRTHKAATALNYQGLFLYGDYLQFIGYPPPRHVLGGILATHSWNMEQAVWIRSIGGWYVRDTGGNEFLVFPGGTWCKAPSGYKAPEVV